MGLLDDAIREHLELKRRRGADPDEVTRQENEALGAARRAEFARPEGGDAPADAGEVAAPAEPAAEAAPFDHGTDEPAAPFDPEPSEPAPARHDPFAPAEPARESADEPSADEPFARSEPEPAADESFARAEPEPAADEPFARSEPAAAPEEPVSPPREAAPPDEPVVEDDEAGDEREPFDVEAADTPADAPTQRHDWLEDEPDEVPADEALDHPRREESAEGDEGEDVLEETPEFLQETPEHDRLWFEQRPPRDFDWDK
jgi:hypothetical protein